MEKQQYDDHFANDIFVSENVAKLMKFMGIIVVLTLKNRISSILLLLVSQKIYLELLEYF